MFYGCPEKVYLTRSIKFITTKNNIFKEYFQHTTWKKKQLSLTNVWQISEDILIVCWSDACIVMYLRRPQDVNFKHNTKHITAVLFSILLKKYVAWNT